jgi:4-alpha-glucanotransferase
VSNEILFMEEYNSLESNAFSGESASEDTSKKNEESTPEKKAAKKKTLKVTSESAITSKPGDSINSSKKSLNKAVSKKSVENKAENTGLKPGKEKILTAKKTGAKTKEVNDDKLNTKKQHSARKQSLIKGQPLSAEEKGLESPAVLETQVSEKQDLVTKSFITTQPQIADTQQEPGVSDTAGGEDENSEAASEEQKAAHAGLQKITFQIKFHTNFGQSLFVTGNHALLGNNNAENAFPLSYLNAEYWSGILEISVDQQLTEDITYHYILKDNDGTITPGPGDDKLIQSSGYSTEEVLLIDSWNSSSFVENTFYSEPFQKVFFKDNYTEVESNQPTTVTHIFKAKAPLLAKGQTLCITGSIPELGEWDIINPVLLSKKEDEAWYSVALDLSAVTFPFNYKYGVFDINTNKFLRYEDGKNRVLNDNPSPEKLTVVSDGFAVLPAHGFKGAGAAIPVFSLRSENSFGAGEFTDIKLLADWATVAGLKLIQILPVNDTTATHTFTDSYPYAAISAFALHPLYLHLPSIADDANRSLLSSFEEKRQELNALPDVDYAEVMAAKWSFIKQIFPSQKQQVLESEDFRAFFTENAHWLIPYAVFSYFREKYNTADFNQWPTNKTFDAAEIYKLASSPAEADEEISMYFFVQFHLHLQLKEAADYAHQNGIILKGDIPIGIYRYSCDAWQQPFLFNMNMQAGAPPDNFAVKGQNWGFPTYNWQRMREDDFAWWKNRFTQMSHYFDAFRIDHILGFFRIWSIPMDSVEGIKGHFVPAVPVYFNEFTNGGIFFNKDRFCLPFINETILLDFFGNDAEMVKIQFLQTSKDGNYKLKSEFDTQRKVEAHFATLEQTEENKKIRTGLFDLISNVILFEEEESEGKEFHFRIDMDGTPSFRYLDGRTQYQLKELYVNYFYRRQDSQWKKEAMLKLPELKRSTNMLICGEDLGMVPDCVPVVMKDLAILSLEIQRLPKDPALQFFHPNNAPYLSVVTPSTHDMSTIRGWWEENRSVTQQFFNNELGQWGTAPYFCEPWINKIIVVQNLYSSAMWSIFQLQDLLGMDAALRRQNPNEERINVPADPQNYWRYRMHLTLEQLINSNEFNAELKNQIMQSGR